jgi:2'-5' RNA ligase
MNSEKELYFIALLPPEALTKQIHSIKEEIAAHYNSRKSLMIPEHITLIPPFHCSAELLDILLVRLKNLCHEKKPFEVHLMGFGHFDKSVLFIQASSQPNKALGELHLDVTKVFSEDFSSIKLPQSGEKYTPHLTIANKDLTRQNFKKAWADFGKRKFEEKFTVNSIFLLKHTQGIWKLEKEMKFGNESDHFGNYESASSDKN